MVAKMTKKAAGALIDQLGALREQRLAIEAQEKAIATQLKESGLDSFAGSEFIGILKTQTNQVIDSARIKAELGMAWYTAHTKPSVQTKLEINRKPN